MLSCETDQIHSRADWEKSNDRIYSRYQIKSDEFPLVCTLISIGDIQKQKLCSFKKSHCSLPFNDKNTPIEFKGDV